MLFLAAGSNIPVKIVMAIDESDGGDGIVAKQSIRTFEDLRGKRVAFQRGLPSEFFLRALLQQHNMTLDDLHAVDIETAQAGAAFILDRLDAAGLWEPWLTKAAEEGRGTYWHPRGSIRISSSIASRSPAGRWRSTRATCRKS